VQEIKAKKEKASKRLFGFEPEVMAKDLEPIDNYDITAGVLGGACTTQPLFFRPQLGTRLTCLFLCTDSRDVMGVGLPFLQSSHTVRRPRALFDAYLYGSIACMTYYRVILMLLILGFPFVSMPADLAVGGSAVCLYRVPWLPPDHPP
jgi:hypothetical protein